MFQAQWQWSNGGGWRPDLVVSNTDKKTWPHRINTDDGVYIAKRNEEMN
jgi:hypothetical protein